MQFTYIGNQSKKDVRLAGSFANGAFVTANSAASFANGAYAHANAAYNAANTGGSSTDSWARTQANSAYDTANLAYNTIFTSNNTAALYYVTRNFTGDGTTNTFTISSNTSANSILVFDNGITQNPLVDYSVTGNTITFVSAPANNAIIQIRELLSNVPVVTDNSNSAFDRANAAYTHANAAFIASNTSGGSDSWARTQANSAFDTANSGSLFANSSFSTANSSASFANGAFERANAAYGAANNATDTWVRNQANTAFDRANAAYNQANTSGGSDSWARTQANSAYDTANLAYNTIFTSSNTAALYYVTRNFTGDGTTNTFTITSNTSANSILVFDNGITQNPITDYSVTGNTITFVVAPANNSVIQIRELLSNVPVVTDNSNSAFDRANAAYNTANSGASFANAAFDRANSAYAQSNNSTDTWVRTQANNAFDTANSSASFANGAFLIANSAASFANGAFLRANSGYNQANSAADFANGAFTTANLKFNSTGGTISGDVNITGNLSITGNTFSTSATQIVANDTLFIMGTGNYSGDVLDIGFAAHYNNGTNAHTGLIRDSGTKEWQLFEEYTPEVGANNNINITDGSFKIATLNANLKSTIITVKNIDLLPYVNNAYDKANSGASFANGAFIVANASFDSQNTTASFANGSFLRANASYTAQNTTASFANAAYAHANAAYNAANTGGSSTDSWARDQANAAFNAANTGGSGTLTGYVDAFTANGVSNNFTLSTIPTDKNITFVAVQGVLQPKASYNIASNILTFDSTPPNTAYIEVTTLVGAGGSGGGSSMTWYISNANTTMVASSGYFVDTSLGQITMTLPASATLGDTISRKIIH